MGETTTRARRISRGWIIAFATVVVVAIAAVAAVTILNRDRTAVAIAQEYFEALAAGDASTALALTEGYDPDLDPVLRQPSDGPDLLTDEVLASAVELISDVKVVAADDPADEHNQKVKVSYTLAGETHTFPLTLKREPGNKYLIPQRFAPWASFPAYEPRTFTVAGVPVHSGTELAAELIPDAWVGDKAPWTQLFPAVYPVAAVDPTYLDVTEAELVVTGVGLVPDLELAPTEQLLAELQEWIDQEIDTCVEYTRWAGSPAATCPLYVEHPDVEHSVGKLVTGTWEILEYPTVEIGQFGGRYFADARDGRAAFTPRHEEGGGGPIEMTQEVAVRATFYIWDGKIRIQSLEDRRRPR